MTTPDAPTEYLRTFLLMIVRSLVDDPDALSVDIHQRDGTVILRLHAADNDVRKIIGTQGRTARSIRTCLLAAATKKGLRCTLEIIENPPHLRAGARSAGSDYAIAHS